MDEAKSSQLLKSEWEKLYGKGTKKEMTAGFIAHMEVLAMWSKEAQVQMQDYR